MTTININININSSTSEKALNMFRDNFAHNVKVMCDLMKDMMVKVQGDVEFIVASCQNKDLDMLWEMLDAKSCELIKENHVKTEEVRALFESECGIHHNFFDFVWYGANF